MEWQYCGRNGHLKTEYLKRKRDNAREDAEKAGEEIQGVICVCERLKTANESGPYCVNKGLRIPWSYRGHDERRVCDYQKSSYIRSEH